ncbi:hypothetical protein BgiMline_016799 [Biomphalaria glabrata]|nr:hypothetical protein BgiMline_009580 [Biomphalaria glabrata]
MKEKMSETTTTPGACQANVIIDLPPSVLMAVPRKSVISRTLRRHRERLRNKDIGRAWPSLPADANFEVPAVYKEFLVYDSLEKSENNRFLVFGDRQLLEWLGRSKCWFADGTVYFINSTQFTFNTLRV